MKKILIVLGLLFTINAFAAFGGGRSSGGFSSGRSFSSPSRSSGSSFGGSRASSAPAPIYRSTPSRSAPPVVHNTTVIHNGGGYGGGGNGFWTGWFVGNAMSHPTVVVAPGVGVVDGSVAPMVVQSESHPFLIFFGILFCILLVVAFCVVLENDY